LDKSVKAGLASIDPSLTIKSLSGEVIQRLQRERLHQGLPSILAVPGKDETHHLIGLLHIGRAFFVPTISAEEYDEFIARVQDLVDLRNQIVHKEFVGEFDHVSTVVVQVISRLPSMLKVIAPFVIESAYRRNDQLESRLKAFAKEVDLAWQVLVDFLSEGHGLEVLTDVWITILPGADIADVLIGGGQFTKNGISARFEVPRPETDPLLLREMPLPPPIEPLFGGIVGPPAALRGIGRILLSEHSKSEDRVIVPQHSGALEAQDIPARLSLSLPGRKTSSLAVNAMIKDLSITFEQGKREGQFRGTLVPASRHSDKVQSVSLTGAAAIESEFAVSEAAEHFVRGTTLRKIRATATLVLKEG
jgi:hypothetical protein